MGDLMNDFKKSQKYLKLGDGESFEGMYIKWEKVKNSFGGDSWRFTLEREDGSRLDWDTSNASALEAIDKLLEAGMKKGDSLRIICHIVGQTKEGKNKYEYDIAGGLPF